MSIDIIHNDIVKVEIFNNRILASVIGGFGIEFRQCDAYSRYGIGHDYIGKSTVSDYAVTHPTDADTVGVARQIAVCDRNALTYLIFGQGEIVCANNDAIVAAGDITV